MKPDHDTTEIAGVDVSKDKLDIVLLNSGQYRSFANRRECFGELVAWLNDNAVGRVGLEATGNYEHDARVTLLEADFEVIVHQPADVRHLAGFRRIRHKNDKADARLIAQATALSDRHSRPTIHARIVLPRL